MKLFSEIKKEIQESIPKTKNGKQIKTFSNSTFDELTKAYLNDVDHTTKVVRIKDGEKTVEELKPVQEFRNGFLKKILLEAGLDKNDAQEFTMKHKITNVDGFYETVSNLLFHYVDAGKKFDFLPQEDFKGSIVLNNIDENIADRRLIRKNDGTKVRIKTRKHRSIRVKNGGAQPWLKEKLGEIAPTK